MRIFIATKRARAMGGAALAAVTLCVIVSQDASAQDAATTKQEEGGLEEIVVTAQRREEALRDVPIAVSAVTAATLGDTGIQASNDLPQLVPSVQFTRSGSSGLFFVRGVGTTNAAAGEEGANAFYVDGVYLGDLTQTISNFNNIERIEVLKGPQGTLFGRNATGGLIHVITREPGDETVLDANFGYANYETVSSQVYVATPVAEGLSVDFAGTYLNQNDGWGRATTLDRKVKVQNYWGVRSKAVARPSDTIKLTLAGDYYKNRDNLAIAWKIKPGVIGTGGQTGPEGQDSAVDTYPITMNDGWGASLTGEFDLDFATLTNISAYRKSYNASIIDVDGGRLPLIRFDPVNHFKTIQQELRLASRSVDPISWQVGFFYLYSTATNYAEFTGLAFNGLGLSQQIAQAELKTNSYASFGEATWLITPTTQLTGGIRYTKDKRNFEGSVTNYLLNGTMLPPTVQPIPKLSYGEWTYRLALRQDLTEDINAYASVNRGFKAGGYSLQSPTNKPFLPQTIQAYEIGLKSELFDRKLRLNLSAFHYDIDDFQIRSAAAASPGANLVLNAATVKVDGVELDFEAMPINNFRLFGGVTYLDSRFDKFGGVGADFQAPIVYPNPATCPPVLLGTADPGVLAPGPRTGGFTTCFGDVSGNRTPNAPEWVVSLGATYTVPVGNTGEVRLSGLYSYNDGYYFEPDGRFSQGSYSLVNASIEYRPTENFGIELWGRNITDEEYIVQDLTTGTGTTEVLGAPATYGVRVHIDF